MYNFDVLIEARTPVYTIVNVVAENEEQAEEAALRQCRDLPPESWETDCPVPGMGESGEVEEPMVIEVACSGDYILSGWVQ